MNYSSADLRDKYSRMSRPALIVGVLGAVGLVIGALMEETREEFHHSYITAYIYWITITLGMLGWTFLHNMTAGKWGFSIRRFLQAGSTRNMILMAILFIPIIIGSGTLFEWTHTDVVANDPVLSEKTGWLNMPFWLGRFAFYFLFWIGFAYWSKRLLDREEYITDPFASGLRKIQRISSGGLVLLVLTLTFAMIDWAMSLEAHWYSTMYGVILMVGGALSAIAFCNGMAATSREYTPFSGYLDTKTYHDLGNLMFALTVFWAYVSVSQFIIVWSGNIAEETPWYLKRMDGGYGWLAIVLIVFHFAFPFVVLLQRWVKRNPKSLRTWAIYTLAMHFLDIVWQIKPSFQPLPENEPLPFYFHWLDICAMAAIGGIWVWLFLTTLARDRRPLLPAYDPRMKGRPPVVEEGKAVPAEA